MGIYEDQAVNWKNSRIKWRKKPGRKKNWQNPNPCVRWVMYFPRKEYDQILKEAQELEIRPIVYLHAHINKRKLFYNNLCDIYWKARKKLEQKDKDREILETPIEKILGK